MNKIFRLILLFVIVSCSNSDEGETPSLFETRKFYMGVTPWPADFNPTEVNKAYNFITNHCDIVSHHFDEGIPYEEAFTNTTMPTELINNVNFRKTNTPSTKKTLLSISALDLTRIGKAKYHSDSTIDSTTKANWEALPFNNTNVITAYVNYVSYLIDNLQPNYINFGVESNAYNWNVTEFAKYKTFIQQTFQQLKIKYPSLPFFVSLMVQENIEAFTFANQLLPFTDYLALSSYPYINASSSASGNTNPDLLPVNFFENYINLAPNKPFCFAETGYTAENLNIAALNIVRQGTHEWQNNYLTKIFNLSNQRNAKFIIWFCYKDYDAGITTLQNIGVYQPIFSLWKDTGFVNENDVNRPSFNTWNNWYLKPKS